MHTSKLILTLTFMALTGCAARVPVADLKALSKEDQEATQKIRLLSSAQLVGAKFNVVSLVEGNSCQLNLTDPPSSRQAALEQAKYQAYKAGADGVSNVQCAAREEGASLSTNCWQLISCTAEAIKFIQ